MPLKRPLLSRSRWMIAGDVDAAIGGHRAPKGTTAIGNGIGDALGDREPELRERAGARTGRARKE